MRSAGFCLFVFSCGFGMTAAAGPSNWLDKQFEISARKLMANISPRDAARGAVIASPSRSNPDYYYHWTRDAALTMDAVLNLYWRTHDSAYRNALMDYVEFSRASQITAAPTGLGEPKFYVDGRAFEGPWGRPQNDGPALRAITLVRFARQLLAENEAAYVHDILYDGKYPSFTVIKADLEYVAHYWRDPSFDLWEEVEGDHFYTRMVQRRALLEGAQLASRLHDDGAAEFYRAQAREIEFALEKHWDAGRELINPTLNWRGGIGYKSSQLDTAVILGVLHGYAGDDFFAPNDPRVLATAAKLTQAFKRDYPINHRSNVPGTAIGRYPEDKYAGTHFDGGNPWVLTTLALAELYYRAAGAAEATGLATQKMIFQADDQVRRVQYHTPDDGSLAEQIDRHTGFMTSAHDLTWSYASVITTQMSRSP
jgi:glucoamylase